MIKRLIVSNYRSLGEAVAVPLGKLTALVGPNAAGKSSIIDVLRFLSESVRDGLPNAVAHRNGLRSIRRRGADDAPIKIRVELEFAAGHGAWEFSLAGSGEDDYRIAQERVEWEPDVEAVLKLASVEAAKQHPPLEEEVWERVRAAVDKRDTKDVLHYMQLGGRFLDMTGTEATTNDPMTVILTKSIRVPEGNLSMPSLPGRVYQMFTHEIARAGCYAIFPDALRPPQSPEVVRRRMDERGGNWAATLARLKHDAEGRDLIAALYRVVGDITDYRVTRVGGYLAVEFRHGQDTWLDAMQESDGTLRVAGLLTALLQEPPLTLCAIEEPELSVHPGALPVLLDFMVQASRRCQVLLSTHSPELLDLLDIDQIVVVQRHGATTAAPVAVAQRALVKEHLLTTSDLLRAEGLHQAEEVAATADPAERDA